VQNLKQSMFLIPDVVFAEFIRYSSVSSGVTVAPPERTHPIISLAGVLVD
jgi:hypothetical protein